MDTRGTAQADLCQPRRRIGDLSGRLRCALLSGAVSRNLGLWQGACAEALGEPGCQEWCPESGRPRMSGMAPHRAGRASTRCPPAPRTPARGGAVHVLSAAQGGLTTPKEASQKPACLCREVDGGGNHARMPCEVPVHRGLWAGRSVAIGVFCSLRLGAGNADGSRFAALQEPGVPPRTF